MVKLYMYTLSIKLIIVNFCCVCECVLKSKVITTQADYLHVAGLFKEIDKHMDFQIWHID